MAQRVNVPSADVLGRMLQIRSLSPIIVLQLLTCLRAHLDIEFLLSTLISRGPSIGYLPDPGEDPGSRAFWSFSIMFYYLSVGKPDSYEGQVSGLFQERKPNVTSAVAEP